MARSGQPRVTPEVPVSPASAPVPASRDRPRLRPAVGGGRRRGTGGPLPATPAPRELWLAIHLPHYMLEAVRVPPDPASALPAMAPHAPASEVTAPTIVVDAERGSKVVCDCDAQAAAAGIAPGMALNSALALQPSLLVLSRDQRRERALLEAVAAAGLDFTPRVTREPPDAVLLEVRGSQRLFGGARPLCDLLRRRLQSRGLEPRLALTPTPLASLWFARAGEEVALRRPAALAARLAPLPLAVTRWSERARESLATMGVRSMGECLRLPRDGLARRFEPRMRLELDRALGREPDPRVAFRAVERFVARRDLEPELAETDRLLRVLQPLLEELCAFLQGRGAGIESLEVGLLHRDAPPTRLRLRFVEPVTAAARIVTVLRERLTRTALPQPVRTVRLRSGPLVEARAEPGDLFVPDRRRASAVPQLVERLRARLGAEAVHGLRLVPEHRPEAAQRNGDVQLVARRAPLRHEAGATRGDRAVLPDPGSARPVWLLAEPQPLQGGEQPRYAGVLEIEQGPERIESGWWDGRDVRRDYYVARTPAGARLWIFRERRAQGGWFLHGVFG